MTESRKKYKSPKEEKFFVFLPNRKICLSSECNEPTALLRLNLEKNTSELNLFLLSAWDINAKELAILSGKYNIDFSVSGEEPNMEFLRNILVRNGKIEIDETENFSES